MYTIAEVYALVCTAILRIAGSQEGDPVLTDMMLGVRAQHLERGADEAGALAQALVAGVYAVRAMRRHVGS
jgi:hypothetical protein